MQLQGSSQVSLQSAPNGAEAAVCFAGVAQLVEHLFCKQVVRGSSPRASSRSLSDLEHETSESCPSGQREQAVNLPAYAYAGSNPALSTLSTPVLGTKRPGVRSLRRVRRLAGVAQLVERQPSKLNVESSSLFSRSEFRALEARNSSPFAGAQLPPAEVNSAGPPLRFLGRCPKTFRVPMARSSSHENDTSNAHLAQLVEHVLGKDEVTSSILVVGSKQK
jgi:hypothetical protein